MQFSVQIIPQDKALCRRARVRALVALTHADQLRMAARNLAPSVILERRILGFEIRFADLAKAGVMEFATGTDAFAGFVKTTMSKSLNEIAATLRQPTPTASHTTAA